jgi:high-affinity nickel-transport protein
LITELTLAAPGGVFLLTGVAGAAGILGGALALGIRHGVDWDHIAAITDITSTTAANGEETERVRAEPAHTHAAEPHPLVLSAVALSAAGSGSPSLSPAWSSDAPSREPKFAAFIRDHRQAITLGTLYALGHGTMVVVLGLIAILFSGILPTWVDGVMERVVGITLVLLGVYLLYALYRFWRGQGEFRLRSRWMLVFGGVRTMLRKLRGHAHPHPHSAGHVHGADQYGAGTSYSIGLLHGIGAETGTQVLIIGTAVGAASKGMAVGTLLVFVLGLLISNSVVIGLTTAGFVSARKRQGIYVGAGAVAAVFSLFLGFLYLSQSGGILPELDPLVRWVGGPSA